MAVGDCRHLHTQAYRLKGALRSRSIHLKEKIVSNVEA